MSDPLDGVRWKLWRSKTLGEDINKACRDFLETSFYGFGMDQDQEGRLVLSFDHVKPFPTFVGLLLGEQVHHLRTALDHMLFALADPTPEQESVVQFPICATPREFINSKRRLANASSKIVDLIESVQPYHSVNRPELELFRQIQVIDNWAKHRSLLVCAAAVVDSSVTLTLTGQATVIKHERFEGLIEPGKLVARFTMGYSERGSTAEPKPNLGLRAVFDQPMPVEVRNRPILEVTARAGEFIEHTLLPAFDANR